MIRVGLVALALAVGTTAVFAESAAIEARQKAMRGMAAASRAPGAMLKGDAPFDLEKVKESLKVYADTAKELHGLFPADSAAGKTGALPAIWENKTEFDAQIGKLEADATAAMTAITDEASFKANLPKVLSNCGACHQKYRAKT